MTETKYANKMPVGKLPACAFPTAIAGSLLGGSPIKYWTIGREAGRAYGEGKELIR